MKLDRSFILIIEDETEIAENLGDYLEYYNSKIVYARNATDAIIKCTNQKFDCILTDINLEKGTGDKVITYLREHQNEKNHSTPIIIISSVVSAELLANVKNLVSWIFVKPYKLPLVKEKIEEVLKNK